MEFASIIAQHNLSVGMVMKNISGNDIPDSVVLHSHAWAYRTPFGWVNIYTQSALNDTVTEITLPADSFEILQRFS